MTNFFELSVKQQEAGDKYIDYMGGGRKLLSLLLVLQTL